MPPNILLVTIDDCSRRDIDLMLAAGKLPNLATLKAQSMVYDWTYSTPICSQTRFCIHTGSWGRRYDELRSLDPWLFTDRFLPASASTIAEMVGTAGYRSALIGKYHLGMPLLTGPNERGFDDWLAGTPTNINQTWGEGNANYEHWYRVDNGVGGAETQYATIAQGLALIEWWNTFASLPKFAVLALNTPHGPLHAPPAVALPPGYQVGSFPRDKFEAMVTTIDVLLESLHTHLSGIEESWIIFTADNGTASSALPFGDPDWDRAKTTTYERGVRVPLYVRRPGGLFTGTDTKLRHLSDLWATVRSAVGASTLAPSDSLFLSDPDGHPYVICEALMEAQGPPSLRQCVVRNDGWKLIADEGRTELYYLPSDPGELMNRAALQPVILAEMQDLLANG